MRHFDPEKDSIYSIQREIAQCKKAIRAHEKDPAMAQSVADAKRLLADLMRINAEMEQSATSGIQIKIMG